MEGEKGGYVDALLDALGVADTARKGTNSACYSILQTGRCNLLTRSESKHTSGLRDVDIRGHMCWRRQTGLGSACAARRGKSFTCGVSGERAQRLLRSPGCYSLFPPPGMSDFASGAWRPLWLSRPRAGRRRRPHARPDPPDASPGPLEHKIELFFCNFHRILLTTGFPRAERPWWPVLHTVCSRARASPQRAHMVNTITPWCLGLSPEATLAVTSFHMVELAFYCATRTETNVCDIMR